MMPLISTYLFWSPLWEPTKANRIMRFCFHCPYRYRKSVSLSVLTMMPPYCLWSFHSDVSILVLVSPLRISIQHLLCKTQKASRTMRFQNHQHLLHQSKKPTSLSMSVSISFNNHYDASILPQTFPNSDHSICVLISLLRTYTWHLLLKNPKAYRTMRFHIRSPYLHRNPDFSIL